MREEFGRKMAAAGETGTPAHRFAGATDRERGFCMHRRLGVLGELRQSIQFFARFTIDFPNKSGHTDGPLRFAAESLKPIPPDHILAPQGLRTSKRCAKWPPPTISNWCGSSSTATAPEPTADSNPASSRS